METIFRGIEASSNGDQYPRFARSLREWLLINAVGGQAPPYTNLQAYLDFRRTDAAGYWVLFTTQYALDLRLTDEELADPKLMMCEKLCVGEFIYLTIEFSPKFKLRQMHVLWKTVCHLST
jgi:hypothetical protein